MTTLLPKFTAIAACDPQGIIGKDGVMPWHYPEDLKHFHDMTYGNVMIMGYTTFLSLPAPIFEGRTSLVFTRKHTIKESYVQTVNGLEALATIYSNNPYLLDKTQFVIGGRKIFDLFFKHHLITDAIITHLRASYMGDTYFPLHHLGTWSTETLQDNPAFSIKKYSPLT